jgi:hypothetical protein
MWDLQDLHRLRDQRIFAAVRAEMIIAGYEWTRSRTALRGDPGKYEEWDGRVRAATQTATKGTSSTRAYTTGSWTSARNSRIVAFGRRDVPAGATPSAHPKKLVKDSAPGAGEVHFSIKRDYNGNWLCSMKTGGRTCSARPPVTKDCRGGKMYNKNSKPARLWTELASYPLGPPFSWRAIHPVLRPPKRPHGIRILFWMV